MISRIAEGLFGKDQGPSGRRPQGAVIGAKCRKTILWVLCAVVFAASCISDKGRVAEKDSLISYQRTLANQDSQQRVDSEGWGYSYHVGLLMPVPSDERAVPEIQVVSDPNTGKGMANVTIEQAIGITLANSPEIRVVSFDPSIAEQEIAKAAAEFDIAAFGRVNLENEDNPRNSIFTPGQSETRVVESGFKQRIVTGSQWSVSYALTRSWDDLIGRTLPTRYEPILAFELKQPLWRDAWKEVNLADVKTARLEHRTALLGFRQKAEDVSTQVITAYWRLFQARHDVEIQQRLLDRTLQTLEKVEGRREIDATGVQIKQAEAYTKSRQAGLLQFEKRAADTQDALARLMSDPLVNMLSELEIVPVTEPHRTADELERSAMLDQALRLAMRKNPAVLQAQVAIEMADLNARVAERQSMPRLDLVASARTQGLARDQGEAQDRLNTGEHASYGIGLSLEYPLGNRQREAERLQRRFERRKAVAVLQNTADQVAIQAKERVRKVKTNLEEIQVQKEAVEAARIHLQALEDSEPIRERLTPEFLLVKLQAQEILAQAQRAETNAIVEFNIALAELAQATGTVLELHDIRKAISAVAGEANLPEQKSEPVSSGLDIQGAK